MSFVKMADGDINLNILKIITDMKVKPSNFISIFKSRNNLIQTVSYFLSIEENRPGFFEESINKTLKSASFMKCLAANDSFMVNICQKRYPELLKEIFFPPPLLFCKGKKIIKENSLIIAVVGTRNCSYYGQEAAGYISRELSKLGFTIASGMALGIDKTAHAMAIKETGGSVGVLGTGID